MRSRFRRFLAAAALIAVAGVAVLVVVITRSSTGAPAPASGAVASRGAVGQAAPDFTAPSTTGSLQLAGA